MKWLPALCLAMVVGPLTTRKKVNVVCPIDQTKFQAWSITSTNAFGGIDADFCRHARGRQPWPDYVWVCPSCGYAGSSREYHEDTSLPDETRKRLIQNLKPKRPLKPGTGQDAIASWVKYDLLLQTRHIKGASLPQQAQAALGTAWASRLKTSLLFQDLDEMKSLMKTYGLTKPPIELKTNRSPYELQRAGRLVSDLKSFSGLKKGLATYLSAALYRLHGEHGKALIQIHSLQTIKDFSIFSAPAKDLATSIQREKSYQSRTASLMEQGLKTGDYPVKNRPEIQYLLGELYRRLDQPEKAAPWYRACLKNPNTPDPLKARTEKQIGLLKK